jgi:hypothetical protein
MAKQIIDIGVQGNDGTGDSIRESFRKVNENFTELYAVFGISGKILFTSLGDAPASYSRDQIIMSSTAGDKLTARTLVAGTGIEISGTTASNSPDDTQLIISSTNSGLIGDTKPAMSQPLNANLFPIGRVPEPSQTLVNLFNSVHNTPTTLDQLAIPKGYADSRYISATSDKDGETTLSYSVTPALKVRNEPSIPLTTDPDYDPTLKGNYLATEAIQRQDAVYRGGDTMTGKLTLADHPSPLEGYGTPNSSADLQAATKFYVDNQVFSSGVNLYVSTTTGDDLQQKTPPGKEGRYWQYAYKTIGAAALAAENYINLASQEPGPYRQKISYTQGPDQTFSTIQNVALTGGNSTDQGYVDAFDLLQLNREFIQKETIAYINNKYVNTLSYDRTKVQDQIKLILDGVGWDLVLGSTYNIDTEVTKYLSGTDKINANQLVQTIDALKYARDQVLSFSYATTNLSNYIDDVIDALCFDLVFQSNFQSIQIGLGFGLYSTDLSNAEITDVLNNLKTSILTLPSVSSVDAAAASITNNVANIISIINTGELPSLTITNLSTTTTGVASAKLLLLNNISFLQAEVISFLNSEYPNLPYSRVTCQRDIKYIVWSLIYDIVYGGNQQTSDAGQRYWAGTSITATATNATTDTITVSNTAPLGIGEPITFNGTSFGGLVSGTTYYVANILDGYTITISQTRNGTLFPLSTATGTMTINNRVVAGVEVYPTIDAVNYINSLAQKIVKNETPTTVYQQSVKQYKNDTLLEGSTTVSTINTLLSNVSSIILNQDADAVTTPSVVPAPTVLKTARTAILANKNTYKSSALNYVNNNFPVINDPATLADITDIFQVGVDLLTLGITNRVVPTYAASTQGVGYTNASTLIKENIDFIADEVLGKLTTDEPSYVSDPDFNEDEFVRNIKDFVEASIYEITYSTNSNTVTSASIAKGTYLQSLIYDVNAGTWDQIYVDAVLYAGDLCANVAVNNSPVTLYSSTSQYKNLTLTGGAVANDIISSTFNIITNIAKGNAAPTLVYPSTTGKDADFISAQTLISANKDAIASATTVYLDATYQGGFSYDETTCSRDVGLIVDGLSIDVITGGTYQAIFAGKSYYRNASAKAVAIGTQYTETLDALNFQKELMIQVMNQTVASRYQTVKAQYFNPLKVADTDAVTGMARNFDIILSIIENGIGAAPVPSFGSGIWNITLDNGGNGYVDQGQPGNVDIIPAKVIVGVDSETVTGSGAYASIVKYEPGVTEPLDTLQVRLTKPGFFQVGEQVEFGETVRDLHIVIQVESGIYYEDYPIRLPANVSLRGDEFRRTIIRPRDRISQSPWRKVFFYRDAIIDALELGPYDYSTDYADTVTASSVYLSGTTNKIVITLGVGQVPSSWIGKVLMDDYQVTPGDYSKRGRAVIDSVSGNIMNCSVIYPFQNPGTVAIGDWHLYGTVNYGRHYLTDPLDITSPAKNNKKIDVFLTNDANRISNVTFQGHGGFAMVLDPEGQIKTKSPYGQVCSSFSQSINRKTFAGGQFIDGFSGRLFGRIINVEYDAITSLYQLYKGNGYTDGTYTDVPLIGTTATVTGTQATANIIVSGNQVQSVTINNGGIGYKEDDVLTCEVLGGGSGFTVQVYTVTGNGNGIQITVQGETNSGLDIRPPQPPCAFFVQGNRYQINDVVSFDSTTATVVLTLDVGTPYNIAAQYDNEKCSRDVGLIIDAACYDMVLGTNYQSIVAGRAYTRLDAATVINSQKLLTLAGFNKAKDEAIIAVPTGSQYDTARSTISANLGIVNTIIDQGISGAPSITYPTASGISTTNAVRVKNNLQANRAFIQQEITAWIAQNYVVKNIPNYSAVTCQRDVGYIIDAICYDIMYGGTSATWVSALAYFRQSIIGETPTSTIPGEETVTVAAYTRMLTVMQQIVLNTTVTKSNGNTAVQDKSTTAILNTDSEYTKINTLVSIIRDYITAGGDETGITAFANPTITGLNADLLAARTAIQSSKDTIRQDVIDFLNSGGNLQINIEGGGNKSMLANDFAMINDLGYAIIATNGGVTEQVSTFTYYAHTHYWANNGGQIRSVAGSNAHGTYALRASGYDVTEKPDSVNLAQNMVQVAKVYKRGLFTTQMTPTATKQALSIYITNYEYIPFNISEAEIDHSASGGTVTRYEISSIEHTTVTYNGFNILKLNLSTAGNNGTSSTGLASALYDGQLVTLRSLQNLKFYNIDNVKPTRPSTALQYVDNLGDIYRVIAYNLTESTGELLDANIAVLQTDSSFSYYKFITDLVNLGYVDPDFDLAITSISGSGSKVTINFAPQTTAPFEVGEYIVVQGVTPSAYNGTWLVTDSDVSYIKFESTTTAAMTIPGVIGNKTMGLTVGDYKIAVAPITVQTTIDQINKGIYITSYAGRTHRIVSYTSEVSTPTAQYVSGGILTTTMIVSSAVGDIVYGMRVNGTGFTTQTVVSYTPAVSPSTLATIELSAVASTTPSGTITFGIAVPSYLSIDPNPITNLAGDGTTIKAMGYVSKTVPATGYKFVTYDVAWQPDSLPIVDNFYKFIGQSTTKFNGYHKIVSSTSKTQLTVTDTTGLTVGMVVTSINPNAYIPDGTTIESIDSATQFSVTPACWVPAGCEVSSTVVAVIDRIDITNAGAGYTTPPVITIGSVTSGGATVQGTATCQIDPATGAIIKITIVNPGYGYTSIPDVKLSEVKSGAQLTAVLSATATKNTTASAGVITNRVTAQYSSDPGTWVPGLQITASSYNTKTGAGPYLVTINIPTQTVAPQAGSFWTLSGNTNPAYNGTWRATGGTSGAGTSTIILSFPTDPGTYGAGSTVLTLEGYVVTSAGIARASSTTYNTVSGYAVSMTMPTKIAATNDSWVKVFGSNNPLYNGFYQVVSASTTNTTLFYPYNPDYQVEVISYVSKTGSGPYYVTYAIPEQLAAPAIGSTWIVSGNATSGYNATCTATASAVDSITLQYASNPGTYGSGTTTLTKVQDVITITDFDDTSGTGPYLVRFVIPAQVIAPVVDSYWLISGNSNSLYNQLVKVISSENDFTNATYTVTVEYEQDPGVWGTGTTKMTNQIFKVAAGTYATSTQLGINQPFDTGTAYNIRAGFASNTYGQVTTRISTCRVTGHDLLDIGTGSYSTTNYPYQIYGNPAQSRQQANEVYEEGVGRVFYVTTDQNGIFRVGRFFTVDQGTGTVTFSASIALSNLDGLGFKRGVVISEFSTDSSMTNNAPEIVPVQSAVRGYIDKRLGLDHGGGVVADSQRIGPGFLALNGNLPMKGSLNMGTFGIGNLAVPQNNTDAANKLYVDNAVASVSTLKKLQDVVINNTITNGDTWAYDTSLTLNVTGAFGTGLTITFTFANPLQYTFKTGQEIIVTGVNAVGGNPVSYNGTYSVISSDSTSVLVSGSATNTYSNGGVIQASAWKNTRQARGHVAIGYQSVLLPITVTGATKSGFGPWLVTYTFASTTAPTTGIGYTVAGNSNSSYNGFFIATASSTTSLTLQYPTDPGTFGSGTTTLQAGGLTTVIQPNAVVNSMVSEIADVAQSKLLMTLASTAASAPTGTARQKQAANGLSSFNSANFTVVDGFVSITNNTITKEQIVNVSDNTLLGRFNQGSAGSVQETTAGTVVTKGDGIKNASFTYGSSITGAAMLATYDGSNSTNNTYSLQKITTTGEASSLVKTTSTSDIVAGGFVKAGTSFNISDYKIADLLSTTLKLYTPGGYNFLASVGTNSNDTITQITGKLDVSTGTLKTRSLTTEATSGATSTGTITGAWSLTASSQIDFSLGTLKSTTLTTGDQNTGGTITGVWTLDGSSRLQATYADIAEYYEGDQEYEPGTVLIFGGEKEVTTTVIRDDTRSAGVVTTNPAYIMNQEQTGTKVCIALAGRVPCKVVGRIKKGDMLTTSATPGYAVKAIEPKLGSIIGKALEDKDYGEAGVIQVAVGRV